MFLIHGDCENAQQMINIQTEFFGPSQNRKDLRHRIEEFVNNLRIYKPYQIWILL